VDNATLRVMTPGGEKSFALTGRRRRIRHVVVLEKLQNIVRVILSRDDVRYPNDFGNFIKSLAIKLVGLYCCLIKRHDARSCRSPLSAESVDGLQHVHYRDTHHLCQPRC